MEGLGFLATYWKKTARVVFIAIGIGMAISPAVFGRWFFEHVVMVHAHNVAAAETAKFQKALEVISHNPHPAQSAPPNK